MKTLSLEQMENVEGGIKCSEIIGVLTYLAENGHYEQLAIVNGLWNAGKIQCT